MNSFSPRLVALSVASTLLLAGCGIFGKQVSLEMTDEDKQQCPPAGILSYAGEVTRFEGSGRTTDDVIERGSISGMQINCFDTATGVDATISFDISGSTGPASRSGQVVLEYFVSILDDEDVALEKQSYVASLSMNRGHGTTRKFHGIQIPFDMDGRIVKREVVIGLQLTREELSYNIHR